MMREPIELFDDPCLPTEVDMLQGHLLTLAQKLRDFLWGDLAIDLGEPWLSTSLEKVQLDGPDRNH